MPSMEHAVDTHEIGAAPHTPPYIALIRVQNVILVMAVAAIIMSMVQLHVEDVHDSYAQGLTYGSMPSLQLTPLGVRWLSLLRYSFPVQWSMHLGDTLQHLWMSGIAQFGAERFNIWGLYIYSTSIFWSYSLALMIVDLTQTPSFLTRFKIQTDQPPFNDRHEFKKRYWSGIVYVLGNHLIVNPIFTLVFYRAAIWRGCTTIAPIPHFWEFARDFTVFMLIEELLFYHMHRLLHSRLLYGRIHKIHHQWQAPVAFVSNYAHPIEHIMSNLFPVSMGPLFMRSHLFSVWVWFTIALINSINSHSGYAFPMMPSPLQHDFHHLRFTSCYGVLGIFDWLYGTDKDFYMHLETRRETIRSIRNRNGWTGYKQYVSLDTFLMLLPLIGLLQHLWIVHQP